MELATIYTDKGKINISRMTLEFLIHSVLNNIKGVVGPNKTVLREFSKKLAKTAQSKKDGVNQEIRIEIKPDTIIINLFLVVHYGIRIPDLTWEIQTKVKEKLKEITGLEINTINVHINGISYPNKNKLNDKKKDMLVIPEMFVKIF
jgi:uncharacterized alkaline shock family protein YloU